MLFTKRFLILLSIGIIPLIFVGISRLFIYLTIGYDLLLVGLALGDFFMSPSENFLTLHRRHEKRLSLGTENTIWIDVRNRSRVDVRIEVKDEYPYQFDAKNPFLRARLLPYSKATLKYTLIPNHRGSYQFGSINYRYSSPLGLVKKQKKHKSAEEIKVYPSLLDVRKYELTHKRSHLIETGIKRSFLRGQGTDFESLREYVPDDDIRWIDWKNTAKYDRPISKNYQTERVQNLLLLIDAGRMMATRIGSLTKLDHAVNASLILGYIATHQGDRVGILPFSDEIISFLPPTKQLNHIMEALYPIEAKLCEPNYRGVRRFISLNHRKRSLIVVFTDLSDTQSSSSLFSCISALSRHHLTLVVALNDPQLIETAQLIPPDSLAAYEKGVANSILLEREQILSRLLKKGALTLDVSVERLSVAVINKYLEVKSKHRL